MRLLLHPTGSWVLIKSLVLIRIFGVNRIFLYRLLPGMEQSSGKATPAPETPFQSILTQTESSWLIRGLVMDKAPLRWGILGAANIARKNWKAIWNSGNGVVRAVASRDLD